METLTVVNMKCGGCEAKIKSSLTRVGLRNISVDVAHQRVSFEGDANIARAALSKLGYPEAGSSDADSLIMKGHSYISCAIGRFT